MMSVKSIPLKTELNGKEASFIPFFPQMTTCEFTEIPCGSGILSESAFGVQLDQNIHVQDAIPDLFSFLEPDIPFSVCQDDPQPLLSDQIIHIPAYIIIPLGERHFQQKGFRSFNRQQRNLLRPADSRKIIHLSPQKDPRVSAFSLFRFSQTVKSPLPSFQKSADGDVMCIKMRGRNNRRYPIRLFCLNHLYALTDTPAAVIYAGKDVGMKIDHKSPFCTASGHRHRVAFLNA